MHTLARVNDRAFGSQQHLSGVFDRRAVRSITQPWRRRGIKIIGELFAEDIGGELHQHRARPAIADLGEGAAHGFWHRFGQGDLFAGFGDMPVIQRGAEIGRDLVGLAGITHRQHDDGRGIAIGLGDAAKGIL